MFKVSKENNKFQFEENKALEICYGKDDVIYFCEFDKSWDNIFIVVNGSTFEERSMKDVHTVKASVTLEQQIKAEAMKQLDLSKITSMSVTGKTKITNSFF